MEGGFAKALQTLSNLILRIDLGGRYNYYPHFLLEETKA